MLKIIDHGAVTEIKVSRTLWGRPVYFNSFFYVDGLLIDTGPPHVAREVASILNCFPIEQVAVTHGHEDHYGNCSLLKQRLDVPIYAHPLTLNTMADPPYIQQYRKLMWGEALPSLGLPLPQQILTSRYCFQVLQTPGHDAGHVSFYEPHQKWLFCGDLYLGEKLIGFMEGESIADHLSSLSKTISLKPDYLFCGLKGRLDNATGRLQDKAGYWRELGGKIKRLFEEGATSQEITRRVLGGEVPFYYLSQGNWGRKHFISSFIAHRHLF